MGGTTGVVNVNDVLDGHVALEVECVDRLLLNAYVPNLQVGGQVVRFITRHLGQPIPVAALLGRIGNRFRREVRRFADAHRIPVLKLKTPDRSRWDDRKLDHVRPYLKAAERERHFGVVAIVATQEFAWVISAGNRAAKPGAVRFEFFRERRRVGVYYFYILDPDFGPAFIGATRQGRRRDVLLHPPHLGAPSIGAATSRPPTSPRWPSAPADRSWTTSSTPGSTRRAN
jgi:hypothetical protein